MYVFRINMFKFVCNCVCYSADDLSTVFSFLLHTISNYELFWCNYSDWLSKCYQFTWWFGQKFCVLKILINWRWQISDSYIFLCRHWYHHQSCHFLFLFVSRQGSISWWSIPAVWTRSRWAWTTGTRGEALTKPRYWHLTRLSK